MDEKKHVAIFSVTSRPTLRLYSQSPDTQPAKMQPGGVTSPRSVIGDQPVRRLTLAILLVCFAGFMGPALAGPPQPGPNQPPTKYITRQLTYASGSDWAPDINGTNVFWWHGSEPGPYQTLLIDPTVDDQIPQTVGIDVATTTKEITDKYLYWSKMDAGGKFDTYRAEIKSPLNAQNINNTPNESEALGIAAGEGISWVTEAHTFQLWHNGQTIDLPNSDGGFMGNYDRNNSDSYVLYRQGPLDNEKLWAYDIQAQQSTLVSDPTYTWRLAGGPSIDGSKVMWSASYSENGPQHDDYEIYSYDLIQGAASYQQITHDDFDNLYPKMVDDRVLYIQHQSNQNASMILEDGSGTSVLSQTAGNGHDLSKSTAAWKEIDGSIKALTNGVLFSIAPATTGSSSFSLSGANIAWDAEDAQNDYQVYAAYYIGPGAVLTGLDLTLEELSEFSLFNANLQYTDLRSALIEETDFRGADFTGATNLQYAIGQAIYSHQTILPEYFNAHDAGWTYVTPEPGALLLALLGIIALGSCRRRRRATHGNA